MILTSLAIAAILLPHGVGAMDGSSSSNMASTAATGSAATAAVDISSADVNRPYDPTQIQVMDSNGEADLLMMMEENNATVMMEEEDSDEEVYDEEVYDEEEEALNRDIVNDEIETYDPFEVEQLGLPFRWYQCDSHQTHKFPGFLVMEKVESPYQELEFYVHPKSGAACFDLDNILQQCTNFRPHYHEVGLHYAAQYVDKVERVLFVGGGDSMMLYEALKYPTVKKVVGLELDQTVTRFAYKYFGSQPHWDQHEKVEWWYGDASKSLLMLPEDYFGSFDLVIVDLSDTAMDMSVTTDLDVFGALSLLLKPEGIMIKNEQMYFQHLRNIFDYTARLHFDDVPHICTQNFVLGSFGVDFYNKEPKDHGIIEDTLLLSERELLMNRHGIMHDFVKNVTRPTKHCKQEEDEPIPEEQERSPGVLMILETEDVTISLDREDSLLEHVVTKALQQSGLTVLGTIEMDEVEKSTLSLHGPDIVFAMEEGYVMARPFPEYDYVAFDIHLWSRFDIHNDIKRALIQAVGSTGEKSSSSYRIAASGIFGVESWRDDESKRGPRLTTPCDDTTVPRTPETSVNSLAVLTEAINIFVKDEQLPTLVVCGEQDEACPTLDTLKANGKLDPVITLWACDKMSNLLSMELCQLKLLQQVHRAAEHFPIRALVVDESAPLELGQIVYDLFKNTLARKENDPLDTPAFSRNDFLVVAPFRDDGSSSWRRAFLDRFRTDVIQNDPVFRGQVLFNTTDHSMEMGITQSGNRDFAHTFQELVASVKSKMDVTSEVRTILGGIFEYIHDFEPVTTYTPRDYEFKAPLEQWNSQKPLALQLVVQLEMAAWEDVIVAGERVDVQFTDEVVNSEVLEVHPNGTCDIEYADENGNLFRIYSVDETWIKKTGTAEDDISYQPITKDAVERAFDQALNLLSELDYKYEDYAYPVGEGLMMTALWSGGTVAVVWDGRKHIDVNLLSYEADDGVMSEEFSRPFLLINENMRQILQDRQPRGFGRVVNFPADLEGPRKRPFWAKQRKTQPQRD